MSTAAAPTGRGFAGRLWIYLAEMFPLHSNVPISFFGFFGYYFLLQLMIGHRPLTLGWHSLAGAFTLTAFALLLRVFDEFKDLETDRALFPTRCVPSGRVLTGDLKILGWALFALMGVLNAHPGQGLAAWSGLMLYGALSFKYFFLPELHLKSLPLTLATHGPLSAASLVFVLGVFLDDFHLSWAQAPQAAWLGILMLWLVVISWETSRKIRTPEQEDAYVTYSKLWGPRAAALVPMTGLTVSFLVGQWLGVTLGWAPGVRLMLLAAYAWAMFGFVRWLLVQSPANAKLRPFVEAYSLLLYVVLFAEFALHDGFAWVS